MNELSRLSLREYDFESNSLLDRPSLGALFYDIHTIPQRFKRAGRSWDPEALNRNQMEIINFFRKKDGHDMILVENDDFHGNQRQAILDEYDEFIDDLNYLQGRMFVYFDGIDFKPYDIERERSKILDLYIGVVHQELDRSNENIDKIDSLLRSISSDVMLRRLTEKSQVGEDTSVKDVVFKTVRGNNSN